VTVCSCWFSWVFRVL